VIGRQIHHDFRIRHRHGCSDRIPGETDAAFENTIRSSNVCLSYLHVFRSRRDPHRPHAASEKVTRSNQAALRPHAALAAGSDSTSIAASSAAVQVLTKARDPKPAC